MKYIYSLVIITKQHTLACNLSIFFTTPSLDTRDFTSSSVNSKNASPSISLPVTSTQYSYVSVSRYLLSNTLQTSDGMPLSCKNIARFTGSISRLNSTNSPSVVPAVAITSKGLHNQKQGERFHSVTRVKTGLYIHKRIHSVK